MSETGAPQEAATNSERARGGPLLSYNVPQQVSYSGQNYIELRLDAMDFLATARATAQAEAGGGS